MELKDVLYKDLSEFMPKNIKMVDNSNNDILQHILTIKTRGNFLWRLWFLFSAPIIWLYKGTIKIK